MNKKILLSLAVIGIATAIAVGGTIAYFSDTETSTGNTFTAGTIDISVDGQNPWTGSFAMEDMKPCYTDYINFRINNDLSDPNPVNIFKKIKVTEESSGTVSEPECDDQGGIWDSNAKACDWDGSGHNYTDNNDLSSVIWYDLYVEVYNGTDADPIWWQTIYTDSDHKSIDNVYGVNGDKEVYLGMIPAGGHMLVEQSYHLRPNTTNWAQGDIMKFDIAVKGEQLHGEAWLENKEGGEPWEIIHGDGIKGILTYEVKSPTFDFEFTGKAPLSDRKYCLWIGGDSKPGDWDADIGLGCALSDSEGDIEISDDIELDDDVKDGKAWLILESDYDGSWSSYNPTSYLWETGLIWYEDTDL